MNNYIKRAALLLGAVAIIGSGSVFAQEKGAWRNINHKVKNISRCDGWSGVITGAADKVGEIFYSAGMAYQVIPDAPAGEYTLNAKAFYRCADAPSAALLRRDGKETLAAKIFINDAEGDVKSLFDKTGVTMDQLLSGNDYQWGIVPNSTAEARAAFDAGDYTCSVKVNHPGGDLYFGIRSYGNTETTNAFDEWTCFGDFELTGPNGKVEIANPDFTYSGDEGWDIQNIANAAKGRGNHNGGVFSKTNASPYNFAQTLTDMPAGKYRFVVQAFNCHYLGSQSGYFLPFKGQLYEYTGKSAKDYYDEGATEYPLGAVDGSGTLPDKGTISVEALEAYVFMNEGGKDTGVLDENNINIWLEPWTDDDGNPQQTIGKDVKIMNLFDEKLDVYPDANNYKDANGKWHYQWTDGTDAWWESGSEREAAALFVAHPELYVNIVEMEFTGASNTFTIGTRKDFNQNNYWQPSFNWRLEYYDPEYTGYLPAGSQSAVEDIIADTVDENAPVEYYNLQGVKVNVENAAPGLYIVKQGKKVTKQIIRK